MNSIIKKLWSIVSTVIVILMVFCAIFLMGARVMGYQVFTVVSGSMAPKFQTGDLIYVKEVDVNSIRVGDPITFVMNEDLVIATHRVVDIDAPNHYFYTKGDANEKMDASPVHFNNVIGIPHFSIPKLGYVSDFVQNPPGAYITFGVGMVLILLVFLPDMVGKKTQKKKDDEEKPQAVA